MLPSCDMELNSPHSTIPPGIPYATTTTKTTVALRSNSYSWSTMTQTLWSLIHGRIRTQATSTPDGPCLELLVRILASFHQTYVLRKPTHPSLPCPPDGPLLDTALGWQNLVALCIIMELANVISSGTYEYPLSHQRRVDHWKSISKRKQDSLYTAYQDHGKNLEATSTDYRRWDQNGITPPERAMYIAARGICQDIVNSFVDCSTGRTLRSDIFVPMMACTLNDFECAFNVALENKPDPMWNSQQLRQHFHDQLQSVIQRHPDVHEAYLRQKEVAVDVETRDMDREYSTPSEGYHLSDNTRGQGFFLSLFQLN